MRFAHYSIDRLAIAFAIQIIAPTITPQNAPLMPKRVIPLAAIRNVSAGASNWVGCLNAAEMEPINAGISASPATAVMRGSGARFASEVISAAAKESKI